MEWTECMKRAIDYMEHHMTEEITINEIAKAAMLSPFYFQKGFAMLCGFTVSDYLKKRRLSLAGSELLTQQTKIIDVALKYGYDSPDSFTKAFTRFHGVTPSSVKKGGTAIKSFVPLIIQFTLKGGNLMDYKIEVKKAFTVIGDCKVMSYERAEVEVPEFWMEYVQSGKSDLVCSQFGISIDEEMGENKFEYWIGDSYQPGTTIPDGFLTKEIPEHTWAIFSCKGESSTALPMLHQQIFTEWLPNCLDYEIAAGYHIEQYDDPNNYPNGVQDENYHCEIWIPIKKK